MVKEEFNILIVGNGAKASALAKKISQYDETDKIFVTSAQNLQCEYFECVDIREDDLTGLLKFALENDIKLTIPISETALKSDLVSFFGSNDQNIFGPSEQACTSFLNKINCKKFLYKNKAQGTKFAIHSKLAQATEYIKNAAFPLIISAQNPTKTQDSCLLCATIQQAQKFMDTLFQNGETDILIQEYPYGTNFTAYFVTDGYSAVLLNTVRNFKFEYSDLSGKYTNGSGCYAPEYRVSKTVIERLENIVQNILQNLDKSDKTYMGFLGLECVLTEEERFYVQDVKTFLQDHDASAVLNLCNDNLIEIMNSCINGFFSDEYEEIKSNDLVSASVCVQLKEGNIIEISPDEYDIDFNNIKVKEDKIISDYGVNFVITKTASTLTRAKEKLKQELEEFKDKNIKYRTDICDKIEK